MIRKIISAILFLLCISRSFCLSDEILQKIHSIAEYWKADDYQNTIKEGASLVKTLEKQTPKDSKIIAGLEKAKGNSYYSIGKYSEAITHLNKSLNLYIEAEGEKSMDVASIYNELGNVYNDLENYDEAWNQYQKSLAIAKELSAPDDIDFSVLRTNIADFLYRKGDLEVALEYYKESLSVFEKQFGENHFATATVYGGIGNVYNSMGEADIALAYYQKAALANTKANGENHPSNIVFYHNLAGNFWKAAEYEKALKYWTNAFLLIVSNEVLNIDSSNIMLTLGSSLAEIRKGGKLEFLLLEKEFTDAFFSGFSPFNSKDMIKKIRALFYPEFNGIQQPTDVSLLLYHWGIAIVQNIAGAKEHSVIASAYNSIGIIYESRDEHKKALDYYQKSLDMHKKLFGENSSENAAVYYNLASFYHNRGKEKEALENWRKSYVCWKTKKNFISILEHLKEILSYNISDKKFIRETLDFALEVSEKLRLNPGTQKENVSRYTVPIYYYAVQFAAKEHDAKKAFEYSEAMRSRAFLSQLGTESALQLEGVSDSEREEIRNLNRKIEIANKRIEEQQQKPLSERNSSLLVSNTKELKDLEKKLGTLEESIAKRLPKYASLRSPSLVTANQAQKWCGDSRAVLEYVLWSPEYGGVGSKSQARNSYCIVLTKNKVQIIPLDESYDYAKAVNKIRDGIKKIKSENVFERYRNELYSNIIESALPHLASVSELIIVPDGNLSFLPFDVLRKSVNDKDLGEMYSILMSPSVSVSSVLGNSLKSNKTDKIMAFGGAWYDKNLSEKEHRNAFSKPNKAKDRGIAAVNTKTSESNEAQVNYIKSKISKNGLGKYFDEKNFNWSDLPGTIAEVQDLQVEVFPNGQMKSYLQEKATEKNVKELSKNGKLTKYSIIHFACHGFFDTDIAEMSSILFSEVSGKFSKTSDDDGYLTVPEVSVLNLDADMVCLSACETGLGEVRAGDGMVGLSRAFMVAGGRNVGVSLWCVSDEATGVFMKKMYEKHESGLSYSKAYQAVKSEFRKSEEWSHPYFWAAFSLYGGGEEQISSDWLFPVYGLTLGQSSESEIKQKSKENFGNNPHAYYINGHNFECKDSEKLSWVHFFGSESWPPEIIKKGYNPKLSYTQWKSFLISQGYIINENYTTKSRILGEKNTPIKHEIDLYFKNERVIDLWINCPIRKEK